MRKAGYQPTWFGGQEHGLGWRDSAGRYDAIKRYLVARQARTDLRQYHCPTVLDVGAYNGYFCRRLADDFGARALAVDGQPFLEEYRSPGPLSGYVDVRHALWGPPDIDAAPRFDIVVCLSVLHHHNNWSDMLDALSQCGSTLFIELANPLEHLSSDARVRAEAALHELQYTDSQVIAQTAPMNEDPHLRPLFVVETRKAHV